MSSLKWFDGNSKEALQQMITRNCVFLVYIGKGDDDIVDIFNDQNIIQLLNSELILCSKMNPDSQSFKNFKEIFNDIVIPSIYLLERSNNHQYTIKTRDLIEPNAIQLDLKHQMLNAIHNIIKGISDTIDVNDDKKKYLQYLTEVSTKLQGLNCPNNGVQQLAEIIKNSNDTTKIKIKVPSQDITMLQKFQSTSTLNDVKKFILDNVNFHKRPIKLIAHRQFIDDDFCQTLDVLNLCPSSTIYVHMEPSKQMNLVNWLKYNIRRIYNFTILNTYNLIQNYFIIRPQQVEVSRTYNRQNVSQTKKKFTNKPNSNIHQFKNNNNTDDDENNTYNGNSTQQL